MTQSLTTTDLKELLSYPFKDPNWKNKFLVGSLVVLAGFVIPLIPFMALYGYTMQIMRRIIVEQGEPFLPEWTDWSKLIVDGLKLLGATFIYTIPLLLVFMLGFGFSSLTTVASVAAENGEETGNLLFGLASLVGVLIFALTLAVGMLLSLGLGVMLPAVMSHVAATGEFGAALRWREWWAIFRANLSGFLLAYVMVLALSYGLSFILYFTIILCCFFPFFIAPVVMYMMLIQSVLYAQAYREGAQKLNHRVSPV